MSKLTAPIFALALAASAISPLAAPVAAAKPAPAASSVAAPSDPTLKLHPLLRYATVTNPAQVVQVIVQKASPDAKAKKIAGNVNGNVVEEFNLIPAFVLDVAEGSLATLAADPDVRYVTPDTAVAVDPTRSSGKKIKSPKAANAGAPAGTISSANLLTTFPFDTGATTAWSARPAATGQGVGVAILDTGVDASHPDLAGHVTAINVNPRAQLGAADGYGHGTHVAGIVGGDDPAGQYLGIAPLAQLVSVKVSDDQGGAYESDVLRGLDWVDANRGAYHLKVANLSLSTTYPTSYATSPIDAAVERLIVDGVTVVASAGNLGGQMDATWYAPGNDPFVLTVGCLDDNQTVTPADDSLCPISSAGLTEDGFAKPDLVAPGRKIVSALAVQPDGTGVTLAAEYPERITADGHHIRMSGTSMSSPMVAGAAALLLQRNPNLQPQQVKQLLVSAAARYPGQSDTAGTLTITAALAAAAHPASTPLSLPLPTGAPAPAASIGVLFDGARWTNSYWDGARWTNSYWDSAEWTGATWDGARWTAATLDGARWTNSYWDGARWTGATFDGARWTGSRWTGSRWTVADWY